MARDLSGDWLPARTHLQASKEDGAGESAQSRGFTEGQGWGAGRARLLPTRKPRERTPPRPHPERGMISEEGWGSSGQEASSRPVQSQPACPSSTDPGPADPEEREGALLAKPRPSPPRARKTPSLATYEKPAAQDPALGRGEPLWTQRPFSGWVSGLGWS